MSIKTSRCNGHVGSTKLAANKFIAKIIVPLLLFCSCQKDQDNTPNENPDSSAGTLYYVGCMEAYSFNLSTGTFNWKKHGGVGTYSGTPFYDSGFIYLADPYSACALNASDGNPKWKLPYSPLYGFYSGDFEGRVSPIVVDSILYTIGFEGPNFKVDLYAIHKNKGTILWQNLLFERTENLSQPKIVGNKLIIVKANEIICYNRISGQLLWQARCDNLGIVPSFYPQVDNDFIYIHDNAQNRIVAVDATGGNITKTINLPSDFDGNSFVLKGQFFFGISKSDYSSTSSNTYVIDKSGNIIRSGKVDGKKTHDFPFIDLSMNRDFLFDIATDESSVYVYNPTSAIAFDQTTSLQKWESNLPLKKITDSTGGDGIISSNQPLATDNSLILLSSYRYIDNTTVKDLYCNVDIVDKITGKLIKSLPLTNPDCTGIPFYYMVVKDGRGYYTRIDKP
jgi:hypothetical protein